MLSFLRNQFDKLHILYTKSPGAFWHSLLFISFWFYLAFFPIGYGFREVMPPLCFIFLILYWRYDWPDSALANLGVWPLFPCLLIMILTGIIFSEHPWASLLHAGTGINKAYILPFIAMECASSPKRLKALVWALALACFWEGADGIYQAISGRDFIMGYLPNSGRLTGSLGDYTVGNYLALTLIPAFAIFFIIKRKFNIYITAFLMIALFWPALFLFQGASVRSGVLALAGAAAVWAWMSSPRINWRIILWPVLIFVFFILCQPGRIGLESTVNDNRWNLWSLAWKVFLAHPWFGAGAGQYNSAFHSLGLRPEREVITISHPHNLYLDILYAHGIIGFGFGMIFICGFLVWGLVNIRACLLKAKGAELLYWRITGFFWLGYAGWLINGIFGHDFYRTWWLAQAMICLGVMAGAIVYGKRKK